MSGDFLDTLTVPPLSLRSLGQHQFEGKNQSVRLFGLAA